MVDPQDFDLKCMFDFRWKRPMSYKQHISDYLETIGRFVGGTTSPPEFIGQFMTLWKTDRDEEYSKKANWNRPFDEELIAERTSGRMVSVPRTASFIFRIDPLSYRLLMAKGLADGELAAD